MRSNGFAPEAGEALIDQLLAPATTAATGDDWRVADRRTGGPRGRLGRVLSEEFRGLRLRLLLLRLVNWPLPMYVGGRIRSVAMKLAGFSVGYGTIFADLPTFTGGNNMYGNFSIGAHCWLNVGCFFDLGSTVTIGRNVSFGQQVIVLTSSHVIGPSAQRAAGLRYRPVVIGNGVWLGARCTILPGVTIGDGAIVAAGAVVHQDVPPNTLFAGVPARAVKSLD
jgi:maltose O-acetyltransferase